jgi:hypothetical protein
MTDDLRALLTQVRHDKGKLTATTLVAAAKPATHPLHDRFEWNDKVAGQKYRLVQAAELIRSVKFRYVDEPEPREVNVFHSLPRTNGGREYVPVEEVVEDEFSRQLVLREMRREWLAFKRRYEHLAEFAELTTGLSEAS